MKLHNIHLVNFRQFYGDNSLEFSIDPQRNITVIHGENGGGKTTILNSMKWCFYGETDFDTGNDNLLNEHLIVSSKIGATLNLSITVEFDHNGKLYTVRREQAYKKVKNVEGEAIAESMETIGGSILIVTWIDEDGSSDKASNPQNYINQILPKNMHSYFFFNGERIEKLANASSTHEIQTAIRTMMGLEIVERGEKHLSKGVRKHFLNETKKGASKELEDALERESELLGNITDFKEQILQDKNNDRIYQEEIVHLDVQLRENKDSAEDQAKKDDYNKKLSSCRNWLKEINNKQRTLLGSRGFLSFIGDVGVEVKEALDERRKKGELPYKIKGQFIDDLLSSGSCICGTKVEPNTPPYEALSKYSSTTQSAGLEEAFNDTFTSLKHFEQDRSDMFIAFEDLLKNRNRCQKEIDDWIAKIDEIVTRLDGSPKIDVNQTRARIRKLESDQKKALAACAVNEHRMNLAEEELKKIKNQLKKLDEATSQAKIAKKRLDTVDECTRVISELYNSLSLMTKDQLSSRVDDTFQKILNKDYWVEIDEKYSLNVFKRQANGQKTLVLEKSTGESQVTSLSFIGGIINLAQDRKSGNNSFFKGGTFPLVMDSTFGVLDDNYRRLIARYIPKLAEQVIILASGSQWKGEVKKECTPFVGKHLSLIYHAPNISSDKISDYVKTGVEYEYTIVEEGSYD